MSVQTVLQFMKKADSDPNLRARLDAIPKGAGQRTITQYIELAGSAGYTFTAQDYDDAVNQVLAQKHAAGALNDDELSLIAGGLFCVSTDNTHCTCCPNPTPLPPGTHPIAS